MVYCSNCGMKLPDWAHYCERCGTRLDDGGGSDDLIERVGVDDTSAQEPMWDDAAETPDDDEPFVPETQGETRVAELHDMPTVLMDAVEEVRAESDAFVANNRKTNIEMWPASEAVENEALASYEPVARGATQRMEILPDEEDGPGTWGEEFDGEEGSGKASSDEALDDMGLRDEGPTPEPDGREPKESSEQDGEPADGADEPDSEPSEPDEASQQVADEIDVQDGGQDTEADERPKADEGSEASEEPEAAEGEPEGGAQPGEGPFVPQIPNMVIDVGDEDGPYAIDPRLRHPIHNTWEGRQRPSERRKEESTRSMAIVAAVAAVAILLGFGVAFSVIGRGGVAGQAEQQTQIVSERISQKQTSEVITGLNGWWATSRTFDGRYWHIQDGIMETYAADGILAKQVLIDPSSVERMSNGPGGVDGAGYYLRNIAFYLLDGDQNTLHAIDSDGSAYEEANLLRTDPPAFMTSGASAEGAQPELGDQGASEEYILPESATRVYEVSELEQLSDHDLFVARNEIYARHGYTFEVGELSEYFSSKSWYHPSDVFNEGDISEVERQNVSNILSVEQTRGSQYV